MNGLLLVLLFVVLSHVHFGNSSQAVAHLDSLTIIQQGFYPRRLPNTLYMISMLLQLNTSVVDRMIFVWNGSVPDDDKDLVMIEQLAKKNDRLVFVNCSMRNSMNNRWIETIPFIRTRIVVNVDDDLLLAPKAITCAWVMQTHVAPDRLVGLFARRVNFTGTNVKYHEGEERIVIGL